MTAVQTYKVLQRQALCQERLGVPMETSIFGNSQTESISTELYIINYTGGLDSYAKCVWYRLAGAAP
jgi:hypothetical protein